MTDFRPQFPSLLLCFAIAVSSGLTGNVLAEDVSPQAEIVELQVEPEKIQLAGANRQQQILVTARDADDRLLDVTHQVSLSVEDAQVATLAGTSVVGKSNGSTSLRITYAGQTRRMAVEVKKFDHYPAVHFSGDITPVFTKLGCNSGGCHGKQSGQGGFKLSVFGFDPVADFAAILKEGRGRRVFPASIEHSLLLTKPLAQVPHGGGQRLRENPRARTAAGVVRCRARRE